MNPSVQCINDRLLTILTEDWIRLNLSHKNLEKYYGYAINQLFLTTFRHHITTNYYIPTRQFLPTAENSATIIDNKLH